MFYMILIKCIVVGNSICKLNVDRRKSCFHQLKIYKQSSGSTVTINKRMNALKLDMKTSQFCYYMLCTFRKITQQLYYLRYNKIRLYRFMLRTHNTNRNSTVDATVFFLISKDETVNLFDDVLAYRNIVFRKFTHKIKCFFMTDCLHVVL